MRARATKARVLGREAGGEAREVERRAGSPRAQGAFLRARREIRRVQAEVLGFRRGWGRDRELANDSSDESLASERSTQPPRSSNPPHPRR